MSKGKRSFHPVENKHKHMICLMGVAVVLAGGLLVLRSTHPASSVIHLSTSISPSSSASSVRSAQGTALPATTPASENEPEVPPLPANATHVPDGHLVKLSEMVHLANADERRIDKERWSRALPIAELLAQAPCDCEQRNWLNHFISMGKDALAGMDEDYYRTAALMQKMARNDQQLADHPEFFAR